MLIIMKIHPKSACTRYSLLAGESINKANSRILLFFFFAVVGVPSFFFLLLAGESLNAIFICSASAYISVYFFFFAFKCYKKVRKKKN